MRARRNRPIGTTARQRAWIKSPQAAEQRRTASHLARAARASRPKCGARRKSDGEPCRNPALECGRCARHGGKTPSGSAWHVVQLPGRNAPLWKLEKKLKEIERRRRAQAARVAAMTQEQKQRYDAWHRTHRPGSAAQREARRRDREATAMFAAPRAAPPDPELDKLAAAIAELQARKAQLLAGASTSASPKESTDV